MGGIVFDANVVIALLDSTHVRHDDAMRFYVNCAAEPLYLSALTYAEILALPAKANKHKAFAENLKSAGFEVVALSAESAIALAKCRADSQLKMPDACVLSVAKSLDAAVVTLDLQLVAAAKKFRVPVLSLG